MIDNEEGERRSNVQTTESAQVCRELDYSSGLGLHKVSARLFGY